MKKSLGGLDGFISKFCQTFKEKIPKLHKSFQKTDQEGTLPNLYYQVSINMVSNLDNDLVRKENYTPKSLMKIRFKDIPEQNMRKLKLATSYKMIICHKQPGLFQKYKDGLTKNRCNISH